MLDMAKSIARESKAAQESFLESGMEQVVRAAERIAQAFTTGGKLLVFGNGGSAGDAQHLAGEMMNRFLLERPPLPAVALTTDTSVLTAISNDYSYDDVFAKQIKGLGNQGDVALGISTSGRSPNVLAGLASARDKGMVTLGLTGQSAGEMDALCDVLVQVPSSHTPRIQEMHILSIHIMCEIIDMKLFGRSR